MALTAHQRQICRLLADRRIAGGERYLAGGSALNEALGATRQSRDLDLFHDSHTAVAESFAADLRALEAAGFRVLVRSQVPGFVEAEVTRGIESTLVDWSRDSSFRFFPLVEHPELGLTLHPFDLATNKVLALVGRAEVRDWIDVLTCHQQLQPLGYLAWAACGKDPGFSPAALVEHAARTGRYSAVEVEALAFEGPPPDAGELSRRWRSAVADAREIVEALPAARAGSCVITAETGELCRLAPAELGLAASTLRFLRGSIGGSLPVPVVR